MHKILLPRETLDELAEAAVMDATNTDRSLEEVVASYMEKCCRLQLREFKRWLERAGQQQDFYPEECVVCVDRWWFAALEAAGGEE